MSANIETQAERDERDCRTICSHSYYEWSQAHECDRDGPEHRCSRHNGSAYGHCEPAIGDVWRCEHGAIFIAEEDRNEGYGWTIVRLRPRWDRARYRRAVKALAARGEDGGE